MFLFGTDTVFPSSKQFFLYVMKFCCQYTNKMVVNFLPSWFFFKYNHLHFFFLAAMVFSLNNWSYCVLATYQNIFSRIQKSCFFNSRAIKFHWDIWIVKKWKIWSIKEGGHSWLGPLASESFAKLLSKRMCIKGLRFTTLLLLNQRSYQRWLNEALCALQTYFRISLWPILTQNKILSKMF